MIKPVTMYSMVCDRCGKTLVDDDCITAWTDECSASEVAQESEWMNIGARTTVQTAMSMMKILMIINLRKETRNDKERKRKSEERV